MNELTARQQQILTFIGDFIDAEGFPPTRAEIAEALGFRSVNAAEDHLKALVRKGAIEILSGMSRGIRVLQGPGSRSSREREKARLREQNAGLPIVGRVAAGDPIMSAENVEGRVRVDASLFSPSATYLLRVNGMSMCNIGIMDGDLLAVHRTADVSNGQVVVARVESLDGEQGEVTVKRFRRRGNIVRLLAENDDFEPIVVDLREQGLSIEGVAVGVIRAGLH